MQTRDVYPPGVPCWIDTEQPDAEAATAFYGSLFGWEFERRTPPASPEQYFIARLRGHTVAGIGSQPEAAPPTPVWTSYVSVESADDAAAKAKQSGGSVLSGPFDVGEAGRVVFVADRSGAMFGIWQPKGRKGAELVNEAGSWNFSSLNTRDLQGAQDFYGAVFGWEANGVALEADDLAFWRLPGYGDFLDELNPGTRAGIQEMGAPEGFEDAVALLVPMTGQQPSADVPPHWDITFAVENADATADRAEQLGATVLVPPMDAPWVRLTVIRDPQGAVFNAYQFVPPTQ